MKWREVAKSVYALPACSMINPEPEINTLVYEPKLRKLHNSNLFVPLQVLTLRTSLFMYSYTHKYTLSV